MEIGLTELSGGMVVIVGGGWALLKMSLAQFERRLDEKFRVLDAAVSDVKRIEIELLRTETRYAQQYVSKADYDKILERIFALLERMEKKLDGKVDMTELQNCRLRNQSDK